MKRPDWHGIRFVTWLSFFLFAVVIVILLGALQFSLIRPYYRNDKIRTVRQVADQIRSCLLHDNVSESDVSRAFQITVDNSVCVAIYNDQGRAVYTADSLGSGCIFHAPSAALKKEEQGYRDGSSLRQMLLENNGDYSVNLTNALTQQEMVIYGHEIKGELGNYYLFVNSPLEPVNSILDFFSSQYAIYTIIVIIIASFVSIWLSNRLTKPIVRMKTQADKLASADYSARFDGGRLSETRDLASTLNDATVKLSRIDELRKDLIANVSHDIKTPLTSIRAYAEMIRDLSGNDPKKRNEHLNVIIDEADYMNHLVSDMSELSKMQSGNYVLHQSNFDIAETIRDVIGLFGVQIKEGGQIIQTDLPQSLTVFADETKIKQVIYNFFSNAMKHTPQGKVILVRALLLKDEETVRVEVKDEGEGIAEKDLPFIWDRYQKSSRSFSRSMNSTGLGLAIVKAILDAHHARYGVSSTLGKGSTFWFELKRPEEPEDLDDAKQ